MKKKSAATARTAAMLYRVARPAGVVGGAAGWGRGGGGGGGAAVGRPGGDGWGGRARRGGPGRSWLAVGPPRAPRAPLGGRLPSPVPPCHSSGRHSTA